MKLSIDPCPCDRVHSLHHSTTYKEKGYRERHCSYTGKTWLEGRAARRVVEIKNVVEKMFPKGSNITVEALRKQSNADPRTAKKVLDYLLKSGHPVNGKIIGRDVIQTQYYHDPVGDVIDFQCKNCEEPVLIDLGSTTICPHCKSATYYMCLYCGVILDVSDLPPVFACEGCGKRHVAKYQYGRGSLIPAAIGAVAGSLMLLVSMID